MNTVTFSGEYRHNDAAWYYNRLRARGIKPKVDFTSTPVTVTT